jgi:hypothetical protein
MVDIARDLPVMLAVRAVTALCWQDSMLWVSDGSNMPARESEGRYPRRIAFTTGVRFGAERPRASLYSYGVRI